MGSDDADEGEGGLCAGHEWVPEEFDVVERDGVTGMSITHRCKHCPAVFYEASNVDRFPDTRGVDPRR